MRKHPHPVRARRGPAALAAAVLLALAAAAGPAAAAGAGPHEVRDPYFGEALFQFYQDRYFSALTELMASQHFGRVAHHADEAEILRGGLYLSYGLHREAAEIFTRLIDQGAPPAVRDRAWYYLAKIRYQRGLGLQAEEALARIGAALPAELEDDRVLMKGNLLMQRGDYAGAAAALEPLARKEGSSPYARFNLGVALVKGGMAERGKQLLDAIGAAPAATEEFRSLRDKANLALGLAALQDQDPQRAKDVFERVRLTGLLANKALLGYGWALDMMHDPKSALVSWMELSGRDVGDAAVLESKLAVPYAMAQIGAEGQALEQYGAAIRAFDEESASLDDAISAIRSGTLLAGLLDRNPGEEMGWLRSIDRLPDLKHGAHLVRVLARHDFQEGFKNYRDLLFLARNLRQWDEKMSVMGDMLANRRQAFAERLPAVRAQSRDAELARLEERRAALARELDAAEQQGDGSVFADARERALEQRLRRAQAILEHANADAGVMDDAALAAARDRVRRAEGALTWQWQQEFAQRLWDTKKDWKRFTVELVQAQQRQQRLRLAQQTEPQRFDALAARIAGLQQRIRDLEPQIDRLVAEQRDAVQDLAIAELAQQKQELAAYGNQARFALAQIYDRAGARRDSDAPHADRP